MPSDAYTALARRALEHTLREGEVLSPDIAKLAPELRAESGVVVSIHRDPRLRLRGQAGDILPVYGSIAEEIVDLVGKAALHDLRFDPVTAEELGELAIVVDVILSPKEIRDIEDLDPAEEGLFVVSSRGKSAYIVPGTPGVRMGEQALNLALAKAEIDLEEERCTLFSFTVDRHAEALF